MITDPEKQVFTVCYILHCLQDVGALSRKDCWSHRCLSVSRMPNNIRNMFELFEVFFKNGEQTVKSNQFLNTKSYNIGEH